MADVLAWVSIGVLVAFLICLMMSVISEDESRKGRKRK